MDCGTKGSQELSRRREPTDANLASSRRRRDHLIPSHQDCLSFLEDNIFSKSLLLIPIHLGNHWCLCSVNVLETTIKYFDSLGKKNHECLNVGIDIPLQNNLNDCGVFICTYGECLSRNSRLNFSPKDMVFIRLRTLTDILTGQLSYSDEFAVNNPPVSYY
ncbi:sentrin-specific protease 1-like [Microplitis demolitor]|uniref:sentrin-specific protease 1-like n=1 Tax=Microplitis demolitor TaxID=69319 RepID=UPI00235B62DB|nr:sentrin-specific protease 1-like [Microplitis demolitor]